VNYSQRLSANPLCCLLSPFVAAKSATSPMSQGHSLLLSSSLASPRASSVSARSLAILSTSEKKMFHLFFSFLSRASERSPSHTSTSCRRSSSSTKSSLPLCRRCPSRPARVPFLRPCRPYASRGRGCEKITIAQSVIDTRMHSLILSHSLSLSLSWFLTPFLSLSLSLSHFRPMFPGEG